MKRTLYVCRCYSMQHSFVVSADDEDFFIEVHLTPLPFLQRVVNAVRYVFGARSPYGDFEEVLLSPNDAVNLGDSLIEWAAQGGKVAFCQNDVH
jgi:hypothetical protein